MKKLPVVRVAFLDVGQGDTIIISLPETKEAVIVDCTDASLVMDYLSHEGIQHLRGLLITHLHLDHYSGVIQLLDNIEQEHGFACEMVLFHYPKVTNTLLEGILDDEDGHSQADLTEKQTKRQRDTRLRQLLNWSRKHKGQYDDLTKSPSTILPLAGIIELIHPGLADMPFLLSSLNNTSGIIKVNGGKSSALLTGDIEPAGWSQVDDKSQLKSDVLKFPHHGAWKNADVRTLLDEVEPSVVVVSVGTSGKRYDHPNQPVFDAISERPDVRLLCTQVTEKCARHIEAKQIAVTEIFTQLAARSSEFFFSKQSGCPCAGTVIVELSDTVRILQPRADFHQTEIIGPYYNSHQCKF